MHLPTAARPSGNGQRAFAPQRPGVRARLVLPASPHARDSRQIAPSAALRKLPLERSGRDRRGETQAQPAPIQFPTQSAGRAPLAIPRRNDRHVQTTAVRTCLRLSRWSRRADVSSRLSDDTSLPTRRRYGSPGTPAARSTLPPGTPVACADGPQSLAARTIAAIAPVTR